MPSRHLVYLALLVSQGLALSFLETVLSFPSPVPGAKLGLANAMTVAALYTLPGWQETARVVVLRVLLAAFFYGGLSVLLYSLAGALGSLLVMGLLRRGGASLVTVSAAGGITHNICQLLVAIVVLHSPLLLNMLPMLCLTGLLAGTAIGILGQMLVKGLSRTGFLPARIKIT